MISRTAVEFFSSVSFWLLLKQKKALFSALLQATMAELTDFFSLSTYTTIKHMQDML